MRLSRMVFADAFTLRFTVWIDRADEKKPPDPGSYRSVDGLAHELWMQFKLPVVDANHIDRGFYACQSSAN
ncbi:MAG TPA: hypothetical protein VEV40_02190 [Alloacidobacterium sp.]|nr:hypothetical protein [Alloacidobacterium sp.]HYK34742.1 hypothetical protein [Alloacidobacterium sp.]